MFKVFYPYEYVDSVFSIDYNELYNKGYKGIIFDIDNTLVHHGEDSTKEIDELFRIIQNIGFKTLLLSNNNEERVKRFLNNIDSLYICDAQKPKTTNYLKAVQMLNMRKEEILCINSRKDVEEFLDLTEESDSEFWIWDYKPEKKDEWKISDSNNLIEKYFNRFPTGETLK